MLFLTLILALLAVLLQTDSTVATPAAPAWYAVGLLGVWQIVGPLLASYAFKAWGTVQAKLHGIGKQIAYSIFATLWTLIPQTFAMWIDPNPDLWGQAAFLDLLTAVVYSFVYKNGQKPTPVSEP